MQLDKKKVEEGMCKNILDSLDLSTSPELVWISKKSDNSSSTAIEYERNDGLIIRVIYNNLTILQPINYKFENVEFENKLFQALVKLKNHLYQKEIERIENEKLQKLVDFFELDIKKQRKDKIQKIEQQD